MKIARFTGVTAGVVSLLLAATGANAADYLIGVKGGKMKGLDAKVSAAGGTLKHSFPFGIAVASSDAVLMF